MSKELPPKTAAHRVHPEDVDVRGEGGQLLLEDRQLLAGIRGATDELHLVAALLGPGLRTLLAELELLAHGAARDGHGLRGGDGGNNQGGGDTDRHEHVT